MDFSGLLCLHKSTKLGRWWLNIKEISGLVRTNSTTVIFALA